MNDFQRQIEQLSDVTIIGEPGSRVAEFGSSLTLQNVVDFIRVLRHTNAAIALYDPLYPSPSDPGAYMDYAREKSTGKYWSMTLGNHGWTGGIYRIDDETLALQIFDLWRKGLLPRLEIDRGKIFSHYDPEDESKSSRIIRKIRALHGQET